MSKKSKSFIMPTYGERDLVFSKGKGCYLYTPSGNRYLDLAGGIAVNSLGHCHPKLVNVLKKQSEINIKDINFVDYEGKPIAKSTLYKVLKNLCEKNLISHLGSERSSRYRLN